VAELYEAYEEFEIEVVGANRSINSDGNNRGEVAEILISNVPASEKRRKTLSEFS
jgi:DNA adenine methylase